MSAAAAVPETNYEVDNTKAGSRVTKVLKKMIAGKSVVSAATTGKKGAGCFKLPDKGVAKKAKTANKPRLSANPKNRPF